MLAPDFPGYGYSDQPSVTEFAYTFDRLAAVRFEPPRLSGSFALPMSLKLYGLNLERNDGKKRCYFIQMLCLRHVIDNHLPT